MDEQQIPPKEVFSTKLTDIDISEDYKHDLKVFQSFKCGTMRIYNCLSMMSMLSVLFIICIIFILH